MSFSAVSKILFITWDGPQTSYLEGLFVPIFQQMKKMGYEVHVLQFGWGDVRIVERRAAACAAAGIQYRSARVMRQGGALGPLVSAALGVRHIRKAIRDWQIDTLIPRSLMSALAVQRLRRHELSKLTIVFDADGLAADERVDFSGASPHGISYRLLRDIEAEMLRSSDAVLCRTPASRNILIARAGAGFDAHKVHIVSNGVDPAPFRKALDMLRSSSDGRFNVAYCGSIGSQYRLPEMLGLVEAIRVRVPDLHFHIFTQATDAAMRCLEQHGLHEADWISCRALSHAEVPEALARCDLGIALREWRFSTQAVMPIKIGEYLMAGLPVIGTRGVGDTDTIIQCGVFYPEDMGDADQIARWITERVRPDREMWRQRCHTAGVQVFSRERSAQQYIDALLCHQDRVDSPTLKSCIDSSESAQGPVANVVEIGEQSTSGM